MSASVQHMPEDSRDHSGPTVASDSPNDTETNGEAKKRRQRRYFRPEEIQLALEFSKLAPMGDNIAYNDLPTMDMKLASLFTAKRFRLVERGLLEPDIDIETGRVVSVRIVPEKWDEYADDLIMPEVKAVKATPIGDVMRKPRNILSDPKFKVKKLKDKNPRREGSHGWHNWALYLDGESVIDYLNYMDYDRNIKVTSRRGVAWFNGPSMLFLMQDLKAENVGIYDSTLTESDTGYWLTADDIESKSNDIDEDEDSESSGNPESSRQGAETIGA